jgi:uncharacterized protein YkwD
VDPSPPPSRQLRIAQVATASGSTLLVLATISLVLSLVWRPALTNTGSESALPSGSTAPSATASPVSPSASPSARPTVAPTSAKPKAKPKPTKTTSLDGDTNFEDTVLTLVNQERATAGCAKLTKDSRLVKAARAHSADMAARNYFDHTTPEGVTFDKRITNAGYRFSRAAENIAAGQSSPASVMDAWMNSSGHRANILSPNVKELGVGKGYNAASTYKTYWVTDFGARR